MACNCRVVFSCMSAVSWNRFPFRVLFSLGKRKKSLGAKTDRRAGGEPRGCYAWPRMSWHSGSRGIVQCHGAEASTRRPFVRPFPMNCISKALQYGYVDILIHGLALGKKLVTHQTLCVKESNQRSSIDMWPFLNWEYHSNVLDWLNAVSVAVLPSFWQNLIQTRCSFNTSTSQYYRGTSMIAL
jgi:hypothetical protein